MVWIYDVDRTSLREIEFSRLTESEFSPPGMMRFYPFGKGRRWHYVYFADTAELCCAKANRYHMVEIDRLQKQIDTLREALVKP